MSRLSTHVLDTALGRPAAGMVVHLEYAGPSGPWEKLSAGETDGDVLVFEWPSSHGRLENAAATTH